MIWCSSSSVLNKYIAELREVTAYIANDEMDSFIVGENLMINAAAEELVIEAGKRLIKQGVMGRGMYLILSGEVEVIKCREHGDLKLATLKSGEIFGEIGYVKQTKRTTDVQALTDVTVLTFDYERSIDDLKYFPRIISKLNLNISRILGERLVEAVEGLSEQR